jgi:hypothetical protein
MVVRESYEQRTLQIPASQRFTDLFSWMPSFKRAIIDGGAWAIMAAYHSCARLGIKTELKRLMDLQIRWSSSSL